MANITAAEHPELVLEMTAMERTTPAHYDEWNVRHQQLLNNDKYLNEQFVNVFSNSAAAHNSIYRGKNLTNVYTVDEICQRISAGTFKDLYVRWNLSRGFSAKHNVSENSVQNICRAVSPQRMRIIGSMVFFYL